MVVRTRLRTKAGAGAARERPIILARKNPANGCKTAGFLHPLIIPAPQSFPAFTALHRARPPRKPDRHAAPAIRSAPAPSATTTPATFRSGDPAGGDGTRFMDVVFARGDGGRARISRPPPPPHPPTRSRPTRPCPGAAPCVSRQGVRRVRVNDARRRDPVCFAFFFHVHGTPATFAVTHTVVTRRRYRGLYWRGHVGPISADTGGRRTTAKCEREQWHEYRSLPQPRCCTRPPRGPASLWGARRPADSGPRGRGP